MISEPAGVAKMTRVMMMMIYHTVYPVSNTPVRNELMSIIGQQPCGACHPKENVFGLKTGTVIIMLGQRYKLELTQA